MKSSRYFREQGAFGRRQAEEGRPVLEVYRKMVVSEQTFYLWKKKSRAWVWPRCGGCGSWRRRTAI